MFASLISIQLTRWAIHIYVGGVETQIVDPLVGTWEITWDAGTKYEQQIVVTAERLTLRRFGASVTNDGYVSFRDDEGCFHVGRLAPAAGQASGIYSGCHSEPDWVGAWEARRIAK